VSTITENEVEKEREALQKVKECKALAEAKAQGKEAVATVRARIVQEWAAAAEAKKVQKLRAVAEHKEKMARIAAENKKVHIGSCTWTLMINPFRILRLENEKQSLK